MVAAGALQREGQAAGFRIDKKGSRDLVTEIDLACEQLCRTIIAERFPTHDVLAEEAGADVRGASPSPHRWIFDPLDGTTNFAHGLPIYCASLALELDGRLEVGAIYDPSRDELFTAERGGGARLNGRPLRVSSATVVRDALLVTGFPYDVHERLDPLMATFTRFLRRARAVRRLGSAALDLCYVAAGRFDAFWEQALQPWDVAAGALMVMEAGGRVTGTDGAPFAIDADHLVASNGHVHQEMVTVLQAGQD